MAALVLFVVVSRRLLYARYLVDWDSVAFADALHHFDVTRNWPHPPGFPVFILLGRLAYALVRDEAAALSWVNCLFSAATIPVVFSLGRRWLGARPAAVWTVWWATQPLFWYYGAAQLTYPTEACCALLLVWLWTRRPVVPAWLGGLLFGLAGGVRVSTYAVLGLVFVDWLRQRPGRDRGWALAAAAVGAGAWVVPAAWASGGWHDYQVASHVTGHGFFVSESLLGGNWSGSWRHLLHLGEFSWQVLGPGLALLCAGLVVGGLRRRELPEAVRVSGLWLAGGVLYCVLFHMGQAGYLIAFLPPAGLAVTLAAERAVPAPWRQRGILVAGALLALWHAVVFLGGDGPFSAWKLRSEDATWQIRGELLRRHYSPDDTILFNYGEFRQAAWFFPEYRHVIATMIFRHADAFPIEDQNLYVSQHRRMTPERWFFPSDYRPAPYVIPAGVKHLVVLDVGLTWLYDPHPPLRPAPAERPVFWELDLSPGAQLVYRYGHWHLGPP